MDEIAFLETALRGAMDRRCSAPRGPAQSLDMVPNHKFDAEVVAYGVKLREWIDLQVDARLREILPGFVEAEFAAVHQDGASALSTVERLGGEMGALAEAQSKLLQLVDGFSQELGRVKSTAASCTALQGSSHAANEEALATVEQLMGTVEELKRKVRQDEAAASKQLTTHEAQIADLREWQERHEGTVSSLQRAHDEAQLPSMRRQHERHEAAITELQHAHRELSISRDETKGSQEQVACMAHQLRDLESRFTAVRSELASRVTDEIQAVAHSSKAECTGLADLAQQLSTALNSQLEFTAKTQTRFESLTREVNKCISQADVLSVAEESRQGLRSIRERQLQFEETLKSTMQRQIEELHEEMTMAFRSEATAVAALDEQLWLTDQRLGQRIDELAHVHISAKTASTDRAVFMEQHLVLDGADVSRQDSPPQARGAPAASRGLLLRDSAEPRLSPPNGADSGAVGRDDEHRRSPGINGSGSTQAGNELSRASMSEILPDQRTSPKSPKSRWWPGACMLAAEELHARGADGGQRLTSSILSPGNQDGAFHRRAGEAGGAFAADDASHRRGCVPPWAGATLTAENSSRRRASAPLGADVAFTEDAAFRRSSASPSSGIAAAAATLVAALQQQQSHQQQEVVADGDGGDHHRA